MNDAKYARNAVSTRSRSIALSGTLRMALPQSNATTKGDALMFSIVEWSSSISRSTSFPHAVVNALQRSSQTKVHSTRPVVCHGRLPSRTEIPGYVRGCTGVGGYRAGVVCSCGGAEGDGGWGEGGGGGAERGGSGEIGPFSSGIFDEQRRYQNCSN